MKKVMFLSLFAAILLTTSCTQQADVNAMLENAETKDKVFSAILDDHELMTEFMNKMRSNEHAMMMMKGDQKMMGMMMGEGDMMKMMKDKPEMMNNMMGEMMKDGKMMGNMMQMMQQEGMMSEECMQSCMKMMKDKGMSMDMGMTGSEEGGGGHESQH
ncbi:MAG: hypothetical protein H6557_31740 [Lewinellaceae bacterium]|nr:hypothetical protein [Phaeodactylibacter sp.]MCB9041219.1 hypothetical protein [Lewinellaceae bacterium]